MQSNADDAVPDQAVLFTDEDEPALRQSSVESLELMQDTPSENAADSYHAGLLANVAESSSTRSGAKTDGPEHDRPNADTITSK